MYLWLAWFYYVDQADLSRRVQGMAHHTQPWFLMMVQVPAANNPQGKWSQEHLQKWYSALCIQSLLGGIHTVDQQSPVLIACCIIDEQRDA